MFVLSIFLILAHADLPIHCTYKDILGTWIFTLNSDTFDLDLFDEKTHCGHTQPNTVQTFEEDEDFSFEESFEVTVDLEQPNLASSSEYGEGTWTM